MLATDEVEVAVLVEVEPHRADGLARVGESDLRGDVRETAAVVTEERVGLVAERDEEIEIAVAVEVDPRGLSDRAGGHHEAGIGGHVSERPLRVPIQAQHGPRRAGREADAADPDRRLRR